MNRLALKNIGRFFFVLILQVLVFKSINLDYGILKNAGFFIYPLFILLMPLTIPRPVILLLAFAIGLSVDMFYDSIGIHAAASTFTAFARLYILRLLEPTQGYKTTVSPSRHNFGFIWFATYASILMGIHLFVFYSIDAFTFVFIGDILIKTILSFIFSMFFILLHQMIVKVI